MAVDLALRVAPHLSGAEVARLGAEGVVRVGVAGRVAGLVDAPCGLAPLRALREALGARSERREEVVGRCEFGHAAGAGGPLFELRIDRGQASPGRLWFGRALVGELRLAFTQVGDAAARLAGDRDVAGQTGGCGSPFGADKKTLSCRALLGEAVAGALVAFGRGELAP